MAEKLHLIIDCDPGVDDAVAIMMALSQPNVELRAVTCIAGNSSIDNILRNALAVLRACNRMDVPVYRGATFPLLNLNVLDAHQVHGSIGLGTGMDQDPPSLDLVQSEHAVHAMIRMTKEHPGQLTMLAIGPLTNLALAMRLDLDFTSRLQKLVVMGGNVEGSGSATDAAEFNFYTDPEAAHIVMSEVQCPTVVVPWETCLHNGLPWEWFNRWIAKESPKSVFARRFLKPFADGILQRRQGKTFVICDGLAMAVTADPSIVTESVKHQVCVELQGAVTRGQMVKIVKNVQGMKLGTQVEIVQKCHLDKVIAMYEKATD